MIAVAATLGTFHAYARRDRPPSNSGAVAIAQAIAEEPAAGAKWTLLLPRTSSTLAAVLATPRRCCFRTRPSRKPSPGCGRRGGVSDLGGGGSPPRKRGPHRRRGCPWRGRGMSPTRSSADSHPGGIALVRTAAVRLWRIGRLNRCATASRCDRVPADAALLVDPLTGPRRLRVMRQEGLPGPVLRPAISIRRRRDDRARWPTRACQQ